MKVGSTSKLPVATQIEGALLQKNQGHMKQQGQAALKLIESAAIPMENNPLASGPVGTRINIAV